MCDLINRNKCIDLKTTTNICNNYCLFAVEATLHYSASSNNQDWRIYILSLSLSHSFNSVFFISNVNFTLTKKREQEISSFYHCQSMVMHLRLTVILRDYSNDVVLLGYIFLNFFGAKVIDNQNYYTSNVVEISIIYN